MISAFAALLPRIPSLARHFSRELPPPPPLVHIPPPARPPVRRTHMTHPLHLNLPAGRPQRPGQRRRHHIAIVRARRRIAPPVRLRDEHHRLVDPVTAVHLHFALPDRRSQPPEHQPPLVVVG